MATTRPRSNPVHPETGEVLTLSETAAYLRISEAEVIHLVETQALPGRRVGEHWRFLKAAVREWLGTPTTPPDKTAQIAVVGSWKDDCHVAEELREVYARRGRPADGELP